MSNTTLGILAHVDSGKTTLSECILYHTNVIKTMGRVDKKDAFLDTYEMEKERGITIYAKQAELSIGGRPFTLLDTPGHVDFSPETERALWVLDYCILVISGVDGVQPHTETLWKLLKSRNIPVFVFVNKMDQEGAEKEKVYENIRAHLSKNVVEYGTDEWIEEVAAATEDGLTEYLESGQLDERFIVEAINQRAVFPCFFGSALRDEGVTELLEALSKYATNEITEERFGARVYKITEDTSGNRLVHIRITSGSLKIKDTIAGFDRDGERYEEKVNRILIMSGNKTVDVQEAGAGAICCLTGFDKAYPGTGLGILEGIEEEVLTPVLNYTVYYPSEVLSSQMLTILKKLEEEEPALHVRNEELTHELSVDLMGEIQIEILKAEILKRFKIPVEFKQGRIVYKETIENVVEGVGHYEPLKHYAEVHLMLSPGEKGSGVTFDSKCSEDILSKNWQRLILTHIQEKTHRGVLTGSPITDLKISILSGAMDPKHTEGGDFRQATYRAIRHGLMKAKSVLLEPMYDFILRVPANQVGRAMTDLSQKGAKQNPPMTEGAFVVITGKGPVATLNGYRTEVNAYSGGLGSIDYRFGGYEPCHNQDEVIEMIHYNPDSDLANSAGSIFCSHGAALLVPWYEVEEMMHIPLVMNGKSEEELREEELYREAEKAKADALRRKREMEALGIIEVSHEEREKELRNIFESTYGAIPSRLSNDYIETDKIIRSWNGKERQFEKQVAKKVEKPEDYDLDKEARHKHSSNKEKKDKYLLVDGYNVIFAWHSLSSMAQNNMDGARHELSEILCNYQGYTGSHVILVFDAYKISGHKTETLAYKNIHIVYTKEAETADQYIERCAYEMGEKHDVTVVTSDGLEQVIIVGAGCNLISAREFQKEVDRITSEIRENYLEKKTLDDKQRLGEFLPEIKAEE